MLGVNYIIIIIVMIIIIIIIITFIYCNCVVSRWQWFFTCTQNMKLVTTKFKSGGLHEKHVVARVVELITIMQRTVHFRKP